MSTPSTCEAARPSQIKINSLRNACDRLGYSGLDDPKFVAFVRSVAGVDHPRFMTDAQASLVLVELIMVQMLGITIRDLPTATQRQ